jgi:dephospho-CoA kinase
MLRLLGITGPIGCGKSTVAEMTRSLGALDVINADTVVHTLMAAGSELAETLRDVFGGTIVGADGSIDRRTLGSLVFEDHRRLRELEAIVHPRVSKWIRAELDAQRQSGASGVIVIEAIRLLDTELQDWIERAWIVTCSHRVEIERLVTTRGHDAAKAKAMISASPSFEARVPVTIIDNDGSRDSLLAAVTVAWTQFV